MSEEGKCVYVVGYGQNKGLRLGSGDTRSPGADVPEAEKWKANVLNANIRLGRIQKRSDFEHMEEREGKARENVLKERADKKSNHRIVKNNDESHNDDKSNSSEVNEGENNTSSSTVNDSVLPKEDSENEKEELQKYLSEKNISYHHNAGVKKLRELAEPNLAN